MICLQNLSTSIHDNKANGNSDVLPRGPQMTLKNLRASKQVSKKCTFTFKCCSLVSPIEVHLVSRQSKIVSVAVKQVRNQCTMYPLPLDDLTGRDSFYYDALSQKRVKGFSKQNHNVKMAS